MGTDGDRPEDAAERVTARILFLLGIDVTNGESVERFRRNQEFVTDQRMAREDRSKGFWRLVIEKTVSIIVSGMIGAGAAIGSILWQHWDKKP